jgi:transcriptional regulator with XRE-family HTH domain
MFGHELRKARLAAGLTQEELSYEAGLDRTYISHLENDHKSPTLDVLFRLSDALGVNASELVQKVEASRPQPKKKRSRRI